MKTHDLKTEQGRKSAIEQIEQSFIKSLREIGVELSDEVTVDIMSNCIDLCYKNLGMSQVTIWAKKENYIGKSENIPLQASEKQWYVIVYSDASGSKIDVTPIRNSPSQLVKNIPEALFNVGLRPLPNDPPKSVFKWYFIFENILLWVIFLFALTKLKTSRNKEIVILFLISSLIIALFIGWTTPVIGAIIRYKMPVVLSLIAVSWLLLSPKNNISDKSFL
jgi:hypothetical protein